MMDHLEAIRAKRAQLAHDIASIEAEFAARIERLRAEDGRLQIAEEVIVGLGGEVGAVGHAPTTEKVRRRRRKARRTRERSPGRPPGIPTSPDMIFAAIDDATARGLAGLRPEEIRDYIREKWWPGVHIDAIGPTAWRMWKDERLAKTGTIYSRPKNEAPAGETAGASRSGPAVNGADLPPSPPDRGRSGEGVVLSG